MQSKKDMGTGYGLIGNSYPHICYGHLVRLAVQYKSNKIIKNIYEQQNKRGKETRQIQDKQIRKGDEV